ncbi:hypothetical protein [Nostoc sp. UHCC 0870]|uniref:hypothetical protein n=1 Tax=Nostoc sp. UHCC 0870 TaxID=2914041 RepID=UPI001EE0DB10|nr:hypothetical protein [Nostoc sp. UHCC 0870]UKO99697.1 hypothetical protein L6494_08330 [Nostoc sp. UHCC 0870]
MKNNYSFVKNITLTLFLASFCLSCNANTDRKSEQAKAVAQQQKEPKISYGNFTIKEESDYLMIPVNISGSYDKGGILDSDSYKRGDNTLLYNLIFYRKQDGDTHLLLDKQAIINSFHFIETKVAAKPPTRVWLYQIVDQDTNKDKQLNQQDAVIGYISDLSGKNLKQVTPNNTKIINWVVVPSQNAVFIKIIKDSNNDNQFTAADKTNFVRVNLEQPSIGTEIISDQIEQRIKSYILK